MGSGKYRFTLAPTFVSLDVSGGPFVAMESVHEVLS